MRFKNHPGCQTIFLDRDEIHIWQVSLDLPFSHHEAAYQLLNIEEKNRACRYKFQSDKRHFVAARAILKCILGGYTGMTAKNLIFERNMYGKPRLIQPGRERQLFFNLSHSREMALVACAINREVGIDIERIDLSINFQEILDRYFTASERLTFVSLERCQRREKFFEYWTCKEAYLKAIGLGLSKRLNSFRLVIDGTINIVEEKEGLQNKTWSIQLLPVRRPWVAALAASGQAVRTLFLNWNGAGQIKTKADAW
jgi:4'-phosphopantetheinyl transferase